MVIEEIVNVLTGPRNTYRHFDDTIPAGTVQGILKYGLAGTMSHAVLQKEYDAVANQRWTLV